MRVLEGPVTVTESERTLLLSATSVDALALMLDASDTDLLALPQRLHAARGPRLGIVDPTRKRLALARKVVANGRALRGRNDIWFSPTPLLTGHRSGVAFVFPGLEAEFAPRVEDVAQLLGMPVPDLGTQTVGRHGAAVLGVGRLLDAALRRLAIIPDALAGHSVGEWTAMIAGGIFTGSDFDAMIARTDLDSLQVPGVEFAVLGCPADRVAAELATRPELVVSHENSTNQTVVCGPAEEVGELVEHLRGQAVICQLLPFRSGFHTPMLEPFLAPFKAGVPSLHMHPASTPVWSATTASPFPTDLAAVRRLCVRHLLEPVRFRALIQRLHESGIRVFVQAGPGQLGSLIDDNLRDHDHLTVAANSAHRNGIDQLRRVATALWTEGGSPDFGQLRPTGLALLRDLGAHRPELAELNALVEETAAAVAAVLAAADRWPGGHRSPVTLDATLDVSTKAMPYLLDHCFAEQRADWPDEVDRRPVVPATAMIRHLMDAAQLAAPGRVAVGVDDVQLRRWLEAAPAKEVRIEVRPIDDNRVTVRLGDYAEAVVLLGDSYDTGPVAVWTQPVGERPPALTAEQLYAERWLFHGPRYQGITRSVAISEHGVRAEITVPDAPGALLDNVGQVIGQWMAETHPERWIAFPMSIDRIRFHSKEPHAGSTVDCVVRITGITHDTVRADAVVTSAGRPLVSISGWTDRRFDSDASISAVHRFPATSTLSERRDGGWWLTTERWPALASREFCLRKYLAAAEQADYERCAPPDRRGWLLARIAIKDAVRGWMWDHGAGPLFPAEILVDEDNNVAGRHGLLVPALDIEVAQCGEVAVAMVGSAIEVAEVSATAFGGHDLTAEESASLDRSRAITGEPLAPALARLLTARALAARTGLPVHTELVGDPARQYVVAWTPNEENSK